MTEQENIVLYPGKWRLVALAVMALAMMGVSCFLMLFGDVPAERWTAGIVGTGFFGACFVFLAFSAVKNMIRPRPVLALSSEGLAVYGTSRAAPRRIAWRCISGFRLVDIYGQKLILVDVEDPLAAIEAERDAVPRRMMEWAYRRYGTPYSVGATALSVKVEDLQRLLEYFWEKYRQ